MKLIFLILHEGIGWLVRAFAGLLQIDSKCARTKFSSLTVRGVVGSKVLIAVKNTLSSGIEFAKNESVKNIYIYLCYHMFLVLILDTKIIIKDILKKYIFMLTTVLCNNTPKNHAKTRAV